MIQHVTLVHDNKTGEYSTPAFVNHLQEAIRNFEVGCKTSGSLLSMFPDFELRHVADFNTESAEFTPVLDLTVLCSSKDFCKEDVK